MTPQQIAILNTVALILDKIGTWPVGTLAAVVIIGPWVAMGVIAWGQAKRFEAVQQMYENNVTLVKNYEKLAGSLQDLVILCTQSLQQVLDTARNNLFCPVARKQTSKQEVGP